MAAALNRKQSIGGVTETEGEGEKEKKREGEQEGGKQEKNERLGECV